MEARSLATIYALSDPRAKSTIRYIGCTKLPLDKRLRMHLFSKNNQRKAAWIDLLRRNNLTPLIWELEVSDECSSKVKEDWWIRTVQSHGSAKLLNVAGLGNMRKFYPPSNRPKKLDESKVNSMRAEYGLGVSVFKLSEKYGVAANTAFNIVKRRSWRHLK